MATSVPASDWIELPGYAEKLKRERDLRAQAFQSSSVRLIAGEPVRPLTLALLLELEGSRVAFVNPWKFDSGLELGAECARFIWHISEARRRTGYGWSRFRGWRIRDRLIARVARHPDAMGDLRAYLDEAMYDAPFSGESAETPRTFVHWAAAVVDLFGAAGSLHTKEQLFALPLAQLWQFYRLASARVNESPLANPSDVWAAKEIEKLNQKP